MIYILIALLVIMDQILKYIVTKNVDVYEAKSLIDHFFSITHVKNEGGAWSLFADQAWGIILLTIISAIASVAMLIIIFYLRNKHVPMIRLSVAILVSGTIGNMIDRIRFGSVVDYIQFQFGTYTFPIFNFADMCIVSGSILLAIMLMLDKQLFVSHDKGTTLSQKTMELEDREDSTNAT